MDDTTQSAWDMSKLGAAIGVLVDRTLNNPQLIQSTTGYGVDPVTGALYPIGQPTNVQTVAPANNGGMTLLIVLAVVLLVSKHG